MLLCFKIILSKWSEVYALSNRQAETISKYSQDCKHGIPNRTVHDRAAEFLADVLQETARLLDVRQLPSSGAIPKPMPL